MNAMGDDSQRRERKFHLWGWLLFLVCAGLFIASSREADNLLGLVGSIIFLVACVIFLIPLLIRRKPGKDS